MGKKEKERKDRKKLAARMEQAEYKLADLLEVTHRIVELGGFSDEVKQELTHKLNRQYTTDEAPPFTRISLDEADVAGLKNGEHRIIGGYQIKYVGDQA